MADIDSSLEETSELRELVLSVLSGASESTVISVARVCPELCRLCLVDEEDEVFVPKKKKKKRADIKKHLLTDKSATALARHCTKLQDVTALNLSSALSNNGLNKLCVSCPLTKLTIFSQYFDPCTASMQKLVATLAAHCPKLSLLEISPMADTVSVPGNEELLALARGCPKLEILDMEVETSIPSTTLIELAFRGLLLRADGTDTPMYAYGILACTDAFVLTLAQKSPQLEHLHLGARELQHDVTDAAWTALARSCRSLKCIEVWGVEFSDEVKREFGSECSIESDRLF